MMNKESETTSGRLASLQVVLMHVQVLGIVGVLCGALFYQFIEGEFPCPLCLLQRMAMMAAAMGPMYVLLNREAKAQDSPARVRFMRGYGMSIVAAVLGMAIAARQVLLHIMPGDPGYGSAVMGWHLYTWAVVVFAMVITVSGCTLFFSNLLVPADLTPGRSRWTRFTSIIFAAVILVNIVATFSESGLRLFVPDNPTQYQLIDEVESELNRSK